MVKYHFCKVQTSWTNEHGDHSPDDGYKLRHGDFLRNEKLGFIQLGQIHLLVEPVHDDLKSQ